VRSLLYRAYWSSPGDRIRTCLLLAAIGLLAYVVVA
jgi:hypothetical protein